MSDLIAVLDGGRLQQIGPPLEVYQRPSNRFVADFLGESNLLAGAIRVGTDGAAIFVSQKGLRTAIAAGAEPTEAGWVIVRPEHVGAGLGAAGLDNRFDAEIRESFYVGDLVKHKVVTESGDELTVKALAAADSVWHPGQRITIGWRSEDCSAVAP